ncbi:MAG: helix-turn-helix transcriptional regulator [Gammaproteobacteria bacterium]|nr:helix-turn-helix transcriptional regulator [Gammaproteobacteria bacterium]
MLYTIFDKPGLVIAQRGLYYGFVKNHVSFTAANDVSQICKPLFDTFNIAAFNYSRLYKDNSLLVLDNCGEAFLHFCNSKTPASGTTLTPGIHLWEDYQPQNYLQEAANYFNYYNGITILLELDDCVEYINLAFSKPEGSKVHAFFQHIDLMEQFIFYFKNKARQLITQAYKERFTLPSTMRGERSHIENISHEKFNALTRTNKIRMHFKSKEVTFSRREYECLLQLAKGKKIKEVAQTLSLSPRTIEDHLMNAKTKANCSFRSQLLDLFRNNLITLLQSSK